MIQTTLTVALVVHDGPLALADRMTEMETATENAEDMMFRPAHLGENGCPFHHLLDLVTAAVNLNETDREILGAVVIVISNGNVTEIETLDTGHAGTLHLHLRSPLVGILLRQSPGMTPHLIAAHAEIIPLMVILK